MSKTVCVLDACALIALQRGEPGADSVAAELGNAEQVAHFSLIFFGLELFFKLLKSKAY